MDSLGRTPGREHSRLSPQGGDVPGIFQESTVAEAQSEQEE